MMISHLLPGAVAPESSAARAFRKTQHWRPGLARQPWHSEIFAGADEASGAGLALALARDALRCREARGADDLRQVLWVQDRSAIRLGGKPYLHGLPADLKHRMIHVAAKTPEDALFAIEEGLRCRDLACVIGEIAGNPRALTFTASRRLTITAERHGVALWLVRLNAEPDLSSARMRWRVSAAASPPARWNAAAPGTAQWRAELFRARAHAPGEWMLSDDAETLRAGRVSTAPASPPDCGDLADGPRVRSLAAG
jgi:protein ImuA